MSRNENQLAGSNAASPKSGGVAAAASLVNTAVDAGTTLYNIHSQVDTNRQMMADSWKRWEANNLYNTPMAQVQRLKAAGINPGLLAGQLMDAGSSSSPSETPNLTAPQAAAPHLDPLAASQARLNDAQADSIQRASDREDEKQPLTIENMRQTIEEVRSQVDVNRRMVSHMDVQDQDLYSQMAYRAVMEEVSQETAEAQIKLWNAQAGLAAADTIKTFEEYRQLLALYTLRKQNLKLSNDEILARIGVAHAQRDHLNKLCSLVEAQEEKVYSDIYVEGYRLGMDQVFGVERLRQSNETLEFQRNLAEQQGHLYEAQEEYWRDYVLMPWRYRDNIFDHITANTVAPGDPTSTPGNPKSGKSSKKKAKVKPKMRYRIR